KKHSHQRQRPILPTHCTPAHCQLSMSLSRQMPSALLPSCPLHSCPLPFPQGWKAPAAATGPRGEAAPTQTLYRGLPLSSHELKIHIFVHSNTNLHLNTLTDTIQHTHTHTHMHTHTHTHTHLPVQAIILNGTQAVPEAGPRGAVPPD